MKRPCLRDLRAWVRRRRRVLLIAGLALVLLVAGYVVLLRRAVDERHRQDADLLARRVASEQSRLYLCEKSNELSARIARVLALVQPLVPTTTTTLAIDDPELRAREADRRRQLAEALRDLGRIDDCRKVVAGDVPTTSVP